MRRRFVAFLMIMLVLVLLFPFESVSASGPGTGGRRVRLDNYPAGPFLLRAVTSPTPPRQGDFNVEVRVLNAETLEVITGADVWIRIDPVDTLFFRVLA